MQNSLLSSLNLVKMDKLFNQDFSKPPDLKVGSNIPQALYNRSTGNHKNVPKELQIMAEEALIMKTHKESPCKLPDVPRSTFLMVFSPDGTKVASTHGNHNVYVTELTSKRNVRTLSGHPRTPWCIAFHPSSNQILASGCLGGQVRVWDLHGGSEIWMTESQTVIASLAFHPTDRLLVIASYNEVLFWDWSCPAPFAKSTTINEKEKVRFVGFDPLGHKLLTGVANAPPRIESQWNRTPAPPAPQPPPPPPDEPFQNDYERRIIVCYRFMVQQYEQLVHRYRLLIRARSGNSSIASSSVLGDSSLRRRTPPSPATPRTIRRFRSGALPTRYTQYQLARVRPGVLRLSERSRAPSVLSARVNRTGVMSSTVGQGSSRDSRNGDGTMLQQFESEITESLARLHRNIRRMRIHMPWDSDTRDSTRSTGSHPLALDTSDSEVDIETAPPPASPSSPHSARITIVPNPSGTSAWRQRDPFSESSRSRLRQWQESVPSQVSPATDEAGPSNRDEEIAASGGIRNVDLRRIYLRVTGNGLAASFRDSNNTSTRSPGSSLSVSVVSNEAYEPSNDNPGPSHSEPMDQSETARSSLDQSESARSPLDQSETRASVVSVMGVARSEGRYFAEYPVSRMLDLADYLATNEDAIEPTGPFLRATTYSIRQFFGNMQTTYNVISSGNVNSPILDTLNFLYENYANNTSFQSIVQLARYLYQASIMCRARLLVLKAGQLERLWTMILRQLSRFSAYPSASTSTSNSGNVANDPSNNASSGNNSNIGSTAGAGSSTRAQEAIQEFYQDINRNGRLLEVCFGALAEDSSQDYERNIFADSSPVTSYEDAADRMQRVLCRHLRWVSSRLDQWALPPFSASSTRHRLLDVASRDNVLRLALLGLDIMSPELSHVTNTAVVTVRNDFVDTLIQDMSLPITEDVLMSCIRRFASLSSRMDDVISREQTTLTPSTILSPPTQTSPIASTSTAMFSEDESTLSESEVTGSHVRPTGPNADRVDVCGITFGRLAGANANTRLDTGSAIRNIINRRSTNTSRINRRPSNIHRTDRSNIITLRLGRKNGLSLAAKTSRTSDRRDEARSSAPRMAGRNVTIRVNRSQSESRNRTSGVSNIGFTDLYPGWRDVTSPSGNNRLNNDNVVSSESTYNRFSDNATNRPNADSNSISEPSDSLNNGNTIPSDNLDHDNASSDNLNNGNPTTSDNLNNINPRISDNLNIRNPASDNLNNDNASSDNLNNGNPTTSDNLNNSNPRTSDNLHISNPASDNLNNGNPTTSDNLNNSNPRISDNLNISNPASDNLNNGNPNTRARATNSNASASNNAQRRLMRRARQTRARPVYRSAMSSSSDDDETPLIDDSDLDDVDDAPSTSRPRTSSTSDLLRRLKALARTTSSESTPDRRPADPNPPSTSSAQSPLSSESSSFSNIMQSVRELVTQLETLVDLDRHSLSRSRTSDVSPSHSLSRTSDVSPSHSRSRTSDISPSHSRSRPSDVSFSHSRSRPSHVSPSLLHSRNTEVSPSLSHSRNTDISPSSSTSSTPTSSSSSSLTSTPDGTSASRSLFSTPLSAFVSGLRRKRKQSPVSSEPESQRRHIALEPSTHDQEQASSSTQPDGCSCWYQTNDNTSDPNTPNSSLNISQLNASQPPDNQAEVRPADSTISDHAPNLGEEGQSHSGRCIVSSTQSNTHTDSQSNARQAGPDSNVTSEPHVTSEAQTLAQSLLEGSSETIAILDDVLDTVIEASERDGVPPLPQGATNERVSITSAPPTAPPSSNTWENVRFLRVPRARPWESWTCPSRRASSPSRIGGVEMLRVPSSWSLAPVEGSHNSEHSNSPGRRSLDQGNASVRNNSSSQTVSSTNNSSVQTGNSSNSNNNSGGGLYLLSGLLRPEVMGGALGGADESQPGDTPTFSFLGRNRDRSPLQYWRSPVDMETEATPADEEVVITSARERRSDGSPNREREDSRVQRLVTSFWDNSIRYERLDSNPPTPSQESSTSRDGPNRLSDNPRFRSGDFQWSFMRDRDTESSANPRRDEPSTEASPFFPELSHRIQNLYQILNRQETTRDSPLQNPLNRARDSSQNPLNRVRDSSQNPLSSSEANDRARSRSSATASNSRTTPLSASIGRSSSLNSSLGRPSLNSASRSSLNSSSLNSPTRSSLNSSNRSFNISIGARSALNSSVGARSSLNSSAGARSSLSGSAGVRSSLNAARNPLERRRMSERNATLVHERRLLTERRNLLLSERRSLTAERLRLTATNLERQRERQRMSALHRTMPGSSRTGVFRDFRTWMRRPTNDTASSSALDQAHVDSRTKLKLMNIAARNRLKRDRTAAQTASGTTSEPSTSRTPPGPPPASTLPTSTSRTRTSRNISGQADSDRHRMVKARSQARHILAMMLRHISSFFQNANLLDVPSHQDPQESFFFHERVYNLHRLLQLALHLTELLYAQLSRSRHLLDNLRSSLNSVTRLQSLLRHRQLSSRLLQVPSFRPSRGPIRLSRESSVPLSVLSGSAPTGSTQPEAPPPPPNTTDNPRQNTRESPIDSLRRDLFPSEQSSANPQSPDLSSIPSSSTPRFLHPRHHVTPPAAWDEVAGEEPERGGALGSNVFLMRGAYGPNSILVPDSYYSPHHRIQAWDFARNNIPDIWNAQKNIVVKECKIHNDASVDISKDGQILVTLLPSGRLSVTTMLGVYSLHWNSLGQCLYTTSFELNAVSVSLSPTSRHLIVGLASRRVSLSSFADTHTIAQIFRLEGGVPGSDASNGSGDGKGVPGGKKGRLVQLRHIELPRDTGYMSLNCIRWTPTPGQGLVYGTNTGLLRILE